MDGRRFDDLLRSLTDSRRSLLGGSLAAFAGLLVIATADAKKKKKKKPCKKKCKDGCCTKKFGKCIKPAQQTEDECGTGGEICHPCISEPCGAGCDTCCANNECVAEISNEQCGIGGEACFSCPPGQLCNAPDPGCCAKPGEACGSNGVECCPTLFVTCGPNNECCVPNHNPCTETSDCCDEEDICDNGFCGRQLGDSCVPGSILCIPSLTCNGEGICAPPEDCTIPCAESGH